ncbi:MAG TPA: FAD-binding protein [Bacteroidia bacterium]|jgi:uncharacterized FAD-dependent dehydrogenase|nr:FAD-binding protein [Bacteroidia bacterium]HMU20493.1 FAD-binding protein [Bacteroidia bacterium]
MQTVELVVLPEEAASEETIKLIVARKFVNNRSFRIVKRSIDARSKIVKIRLQLQWTDKQDAFTENRKWQQVGNLEPVIIAGCGPAGLFAATRLIECGYKPVIIERGKDVRNRRRDLAAINKQRQINPESNYCFGEGGAGTYSDGKLYTRSNKRGNIASVLKTFIEHGAAADIAVDAHPHIGTNKLPAIISAMRNRIIECGGEVLFNTKLLNIDFDASGVNGVEVQQGATQYHIKSKALILATGHSARDVFYMLNNQRIMIEAKPIAIGVRAEHQQRLIDSVQYHCNTRNPFLPPASYALKHQHDGRGIYSFCMCPGGIIAPAATGIGEVVVNGWSPSRRNNVYANSGIVVNITEDDVQPFRKAKELRYLEFQKKIEQQAFISGGSNLAAPAQRMVDFVNNKTSSTLPSCSYIPGINSVNLNEIFPASVITSLAAAFVTFGKKMKGYYTNEAVLVGTESRTSSPIRIPRDVDTAMHIQVQGLFPCGEGAGYAGGIVSAAMDGEFCAEKCASYLKNNN